MQGIRVQDLLIPDEQSLDNLPEQGESSAKTRLAPPELKYFLIEFIHDTVCPFCYIGMKNLLAAIDIYKSRHSDAVFEVTCTPSILAPTTADINYDKVYYYSGYRKLPASRFEIWDTLGKNAGIKFSWKGRVGQSRNSHKMLRYALQKTPTTQRSIELTVYRPSGDTPLYPPYSLRAPELPVSVAQPRGPDLQMRLLDAITTQFHEHDKDLSDPQFLVRITHRVTGFPQHEIQSVLASKEWDQTIDTLSQEVKDRVSVRNRLAGPIIAVPTMVLNNKWVYGGFQGVAEIVDQFELLRQGIQPAQEYTKSSLVLEGGVADTVAREEILAKDRQGNKGDGQLPVT